MNAGKRIYPYQNSGAGVWHTYSKILGRQYLLSSSYKEFMLKTILAGAEQKSYEGLESSFYLLYTVSRFIDIHSYDTI